MAQGPIQVSQLHVLLLSAKHGLLAGVGKFDRIAYIGDSYGLTLGNYLVKNFPGDADALVLNGYSSTVTFPTDLVPGFHSATTISPRFKHTPLSYLTISAEESRTAAFYGAKFDQSLTAITLRVS